MAPIEVTARVSCSCDPVFHFHVLQEFGSEGIFACVHCGQVSCTQVIGDDGRGGGESWMKTIALDLSEQAFKWLRCWPRRFSLEAYPDQTFFLPEDQTYRTPGKLQQGLADWAEKTQSWTLAEKIRKAGFPTEAPPSGLPYFALSFARIGEAVMLKPETSVEVLAEYAMRSPFEFEILKDQLLGQPNLDDLLCEWITYEPTDLHWYSKNIGVLYFLAFDLIRAQKEARPKVLKTLLDNIAQMPVQRSPYGHDELLYAFKLDEALSVLRTIPVDVHEATTAIQTLKQRIGEREVRSLKAINQTLGRLREKGNL